MMIALRIVRCFAEPDTLVWSATMAGSAFSDTVAKLYLAATDNNQWGAALQAIEELTGSAGAVIDFVPRSTLRPPHTIAGRFTQEQCAEFAGVYQPMCRRLAYGLSHPEAKFHCDGLFISEKEMDTDPVYDWLGSHGLRYYIGKGLPQTENYHLYFTLQRSPKQGHVQRDDIELFTEISRHVSQAIQIAIRLGTLHAQESVNRAVFEALPHSVVILNANGQIIFANLQASTLLRERDGLFAAGGLVASIPDEQRTLDGLVRSAGSLGSEGSGAWMRISRPSGRLPYAVFVAPIVTATDIFAGALTSVLVIIHDPSTRLAPGIEILRTIYGLRPSEARLARALAQGHDLASASAELGMAIGTARTHLKQIFRKLGISRQAELVRLLSGLPVCP